MRSRRIFCLLAAAAGMAVLGATLCDGRVFFRTGRSGQAAALADELGGRVTYQTQARINGGRGDLTVIALPISFEEAARLLGRGSGSARTHFFAADQVGSGVIIEGDVVTRLFLMALPPATSSRAAACLLLSIRQSAAEYADSLRPLARHLLEGVPCYPGSTPVNFWADETARLNVEMSRTGDRSAVVADYFAGALKADGWSPAPPGTPAPSAEPGSLLYVKGNRLCCVGIRAGDEGETLITVLHKELGSE